MRLATISAALLVSLLTVAGCAGETDEATDSSDDAIVGGQRDTDPAHEAVVAIYWMDKREVIGTGVLIAPNVIVTAEHTSSLYDPSELQIRVGDDSGRPRQRIEIRSVVRTTAEGTASVAGYGADVAYFILSRNVTGVTPLPMLDRSLDTSDLGRQVTLVGYGQTRPEFAAAAGRYRATATNVITAVSGPPRPNALAPTTPVPTTGTPLREGYEAQTEQTGNGYNCSGDSGGPQLATLNGVLTVMALSSAQSSNRTRCTTSYTIVSSFGPEVQAAKARALAEAGH